MQRLTRITMGLLLFVTILSIPLPLLAAPYLKLNPNANPIYGTTAINGTITGPYTLEVDAGGSESIHAFFNQDKDCQGYTSASPSTAIVTDKKQRYLRFFAISKGDTTLVVQGPNNKWFCGDDYSQDDLNPIINLPNAAIGKYNIWVGSFERQTLSAILVISNDKYDPSNFSGIVEADQQVASLTGTGGASPESSIVSQAEVTADKLNIRTGPGTNYSISSQLEKGNIVNIIGQIASCQWLNVEYSLVTGQIRRGWIAGSSRYVSIGTTCDTIPKLEASKIGSPLYLSNSCNRPIEVAILYKQLTGQWLIDGWWKFEPTTASYLSNSQGLDVLSNNRIFYFYAIATDGSDIVWQGEEEREFQDHLLPMREIELSVDSYGDFVLDLSCRDEPGANYIDLICIDNLTDVNINYEFRWGNEQWKSNRVENQLAKLHWWEFAAGESSSPKFEIRFDADFTDAVQRITYTLEKKRATNTNCNDGKIFQFDYIDDNHIDLFSLD